MKLKFIFILLLLFTSSFTFSQIEFDERDWEEIILDAQNSNKLIFVYIYSEWAGPCKWMESKIFSDSKISLLYNENFLNVKVHIESPLGKSMKKIHDIKRIPSYIYLNKNEEEVYSKFGKLSLIEFSELSKGILRTY